MVMAVLIVMLLGGISLTRIAVDLYPEIKLPVGAVSTSYSGAGPQEVEELVTKPLEEILGTVNGVDQIVSDTTEGSSTVIVWFDWGTDMDFATLKMREKVDFIKSFMPEDISNPMVMQMDPAMMPILQIGLSGGRDLSRLKAFAEDDISSRLERLEGVASVFITGGYTREIKVSVDPVKLEQYGLTLAQISQTLRAENVNMSTGQVVEGKQELFVRTLGEYETVEDIRNVVLTVPNGGGAIRLSDLAAIEDGFKDVDQITRMNGEPSIGISVMKQSHANTVQVAERVKAELEQIKSSAPGGMDIAMIFDQSEFINQSIGRVVSNTILGGIFAVLVLFLFLRNLRSTLIIAIAIPISIVSAFTLIYFNDLTLNMMSMGGLALGVGMMVDSAIVILENIYRYRQDGHGMMQAAILGSDEVASAVIASTITTIAVFLPIVFVEGIAAQLFKQLALTVSFALAAALLVALTLIPMLSSKFLVITNGNGKVKKRNPLRKIMDGLAQGLDKLTAVYSKLLAWALGHRKTVVAAVTVALISSFALVPMVGMEFLPSMDSGELAVNIELNRGSLLEETEKITEQVEDILYDVPEVDTVFTSVGVSQNQLGMGGAQQHRSQIRVMLVDKEQRSRGTDVVADELRNSFAGIAGADIEVSAVDANQMGGGSSAPVAVKIKGNDLVTLEKLANQVLTIVESVPGTREVESSFVDGSPELQLLINRDKAASYGINVAQLASAVQTAMHGQVATKFGIEDNEIDVRVIYPEWARKNLQDLKDVTIPSPMGINVPVSEVVTIKQDVGPGTISREDQARVASVQAQIAGRDLGSITSDLEAKLQPLRQQLPKGYEIILGGQQEEMMEAFGNLGLALILAIILVYMVMASQFESLVHPFVIMFSLPTTFIGVVAALVVTGRSFSVPTFIGVIMLAGIVVNNAIVLIDYINVLRERGHERDEAVLQAGPVRLRPILMTTLTTVLALLPTAAGIGSGSEASAPMAVAVVGGLSVSMIFTLVFLPVVYTIVDDFGQWTKRKIGKGSADKADSGQSI